MSPSTGGRVVARPNTSATPARTGIDHGTGQVVDVRLGFGEEFGVLAPQFLARFIRTTAAHREVAALLTDDFHDPSRMLDVLYARGHLQVIEMANSMLSGMVMRGLVLVSNTDEVAHRSVEGHSPVSDWGRAGACEE